MGTTMDYTLSVPINFILDLRNLGVQLFFIISGFVIFMTLERTKSSVDFAVSRFSRLYPAYWMAMFLSIIFVLLVSNPFHYSELSVEQILINITMLQHWVKVKDIDAVYWTLSVELTFYFLMWMVFYFKKLHLIYYIGFVWLTIALSDQLIILPFKHVLDQVLILNYAPMFVAGIAFYSIKNGRSTALIINLVIYSFIVEGFVLYKANHSFTPVFVTLSLFLILPQFARGILKLGITRYFGCLVISLIVYI